MKPDSIEYNKITKWMKKLGIEDTFLKINKEHDLTFGILNG
jgi:hypothetical protein